MRRSARLKPCPDARRHDTFHQPVRAYGARQCSILPGCSGGIAPAADFSAEFGRRIHLTNIRYHASLTNEVAASRAGLLRPAAVSLWLVGAGLVPAQGRPRGAPLAWPTLPVPCAIQHKNRSVKRRKLRCKGQIDGNGKIPFVGYETGAGSLKNKAARPFWPAKTKKRILFLKTNLGSY